MPNQRFGKRRLCGENHGGQRDGDEEDGEDVSLTHYSLATF